MAAAPLRRWRLCRPEAADGVARDRHLDRPDLKRSDQAQGFELLPRRWVVERTFAWLGRNRRLAKDYEASIPSSECWLCLAAVKLLTRGLSV